MATEENVITTATVEQVIAAKTVQRIVAGQTIDRVVDHAAVEHVVTGCPNQRTKQTQREIATRRKPARIGRGNGNANVPRLSTRRRHPAEATARRIKTQPPGQRVTIGQACTQYQAVAGINIGKGIRRQGVGKGLPQPIKLVEQRHLQCRRVIHRHQVNILGSGSRTTMAIDHLVIERNCAVEVGIRHEGPAAIAVIEQRAVVGAEVGDGQGVTVRIAGIGQ
ncbi:hypothetical protein D3C76_902700 [compost metagenome]